MFGVVSKVQGASIDGYSFEYDGHPCIIVTKRYDRIDNLAFSVMHELGHVKNHDYDDFNVDIDDYDHESSCEKAANQFAANALIPDADWKTVPKVRLSAIVIQKAWKREQGCILKAVLHPLLKFRYLKLMLLFLSAFAVSIASVFFCDAQVLGEKPLLPNVNTADDKAVALSRIYL